MKRTLLLILCAGLFWNCSSSMPDWYNEREAYYPAKDYIVSEGWGENPEKAIEKATINMARIFNTKVTVETTIIERYQSISDMTYFDEYKAEFSEETARLISDQNLVNIMFVEPAYARKSKAYFTLAYIERVPTIKILVDRMKRNNENVEYFVQMAESNRDPVTKYHYYTKAWLTAGKNKMIQEQLDLLAPGLGNTPIYTYDQLEALKNETAATIRFAVNVKGDANGRIAQAVRTAINNAGFSVHEEDALLTVAVNTQIKTIDIDQDKLSFVSWELHVTMNRNHSETLLSMMEEGREGSTNIENARLHAYESMQSYIETQFANALVAYFDTHKK